MDAPYFARTQGKRAVAITLVAVAYWLSRAPSLPDPARAEMARRFQFVRWPLPTVPGPTPKYVREVNPSLETIRAWISAVGAGAAVGDLRQRGHCGDVVYVDTRTDQVIVAAIPRRDGPPDAGDGEGARAFVLDPSGKLAYDPATTAPTGVLITHDDRGLPAIVTSYWGCSPIAWFLKSETPSEVLPTSFEPVELVPPGADGKPPRWYTCAAIQSDLDCDGRVDLVFANYFPDGSEILGIGSRTPMRMHNSMSNADNGGLKHFLLRKRPARGTPMSFEEREPTIIVNGARCDQQTKRKILCRWTLAMAAVDLEGNQRPVLCLVNDFGPDCFFLNRSSPGDLVLELTRGRRGFFTPKSKVVGRDSSKGMGIEAFDLECDGRFAMSISNISDPFALHEGHVLLVRRRGSESINSDDAPYRDEARRVGVHSGGWGWDCRAASFDNGETPQLVRACGFTQARRVGGDGTGAVRAFFGQRWAWLHETATGNDNFLKYPCMWMRCEPGDELSGGNTTAFFVRDDHGMYWDIGRSVGFTTADLGRGIATCDPDGSGRICMVVANQWNDSFVYYNLAETTNTFVGLNVLMPLQRTESAHPTVFSQPPSRPLRARPAYGATVTLRLPNDRKQIQQVDGGSGHTGKKSPALHYGIGAVPVGALLDAEFAWRDGNGALRRATVSVVAGRWQTILLGWPESGG